MKRITIEVTEQQQHRLKAMAALQGQSIKDFVLASTIGTGDEAAALEELEALLEYFLSGGGCGKLNPATATATNQIQNYSYFSTQDPPFPAPAATPAPSVGFKANSRYQGVFEGSRSGVLLIFGFKIIEKC